MGRLMEHLRSPQFTDSEGRETVKRHRLSLLVGTGIPRWRAYLHESVVAIIGIVMLIGAVDWLGLYDQYLAGVLGSPELSSKGEPSITLLGYQVGLFTVVGALILASAIGGFIDTWRGKRFFGLFFRE
jgi:hypothetical protein